ncbi:MAG: hypothetical protein KAJ06_06770 [Gammaproteobacteria bacterium]|nr:hypothetical protein [Gammaproteobacteria bacterium]
MSELRAAKSGDHGSFPGSTFVVDDTPPNTQCQESPIAAADGLSITDDTIISDVEAFLGIDLTGKKVTVTAPPADVGTFNILSNVGNIIFTDHVFIETGPNVNYSVHDAGQAYLTRNESSFTRFIENEGKAHTTKGGQLFTDIENPPLADACSDTFNPN